MSPVNFAYYPTPSKTLQICIFFIIVMIKSFYFCLVCCVQAALQWPRRESTYVTSSRNFPVLYGDRMPTGNRITAVPASAPGAHVLSAPVSQNDVIQPHHLYYQRQYEDGETVEQTPVSRHYGEAFFSNIDESPSSGVQTNMAYDYRPKCIYFSHKSLVIITTS